MRGTVHGLRSPLPLSDTLPGLLRRTGSPGTVWQLRRGARTGAAQPGRVLAYLDLARRRRDMVEWAGHLGGA